jgi:hypothetical protein
LTSTSPLSAILMSTPAPVADGVELDLAVRLQADVGAGFGLAVELLEIDAHRAVEAEQFRADRGAGRVGHADAAHAEHVAQRAIDQQVAEPVLQAIAEADRLAIEDVGAAAFGHRHEVVEHGLFELAGVLHADHDRGQQALEDARRGEIAGWADFAQVGHHRIAGLRAVDGETGDQRLGVGEQVVADPGHGQVGEDVTVGAEMIDLYATLCRGDERRVRLANPFGLPVVPEV